MDLSELRANASRLLGESGGATFYPTADLDDWINQGQLELVVLSAALWKKAGTRPLLEKTASLSTTGGDWRIYPYNTFSDFIWPTRVTWNDAPLERARMNDIDRYDPDWSITAGDPAYWGMLGLNLMWISPVPATSQTLKVTYVYVPPTLSAAGNVPAIPGEYHALLEHYAAYMGLLKEGGTKLDAAKWHYSQFMVF